MAPENYILPNAQDAARLGLKDGDLVKVVSPDSPEGVWDLGNGQKRPMVGKAKVVQGLRPGVIVFSLGHGHRAYGASDIVIDGQVIRVIRAGRRASMPMRPCGWTRT